MQSNLTENQPPSLLWLSVPVVIALSAFFARKWYLGYKLRKHGIGKGAPGFQTSVRKIRVTPEIAARIRRGEEVSPEEIAAAAARMEREEQANSTQENKKQATSAQEKVQVSQAPSEPVNEWLPEKLSTPKKRSKGKKR